MVQKTALLIRFEAESLDPIWSNTVTKVSGSEPRQTLEKLAWKICANDRLPIAIDEADRTQLEQAISDGILLENEQGLQFADESTMVSAAAQHVLREQGTQLQSSPIACFEALHEIWRDEIGKPGAVSGHVLAALHNAGRLDAFVWGRHAIEGGVNVFNVLHIVKGALAQFEYAHAEAINEFFAGHHEQVKNDLAGNVLYSELPAWLAQHPGLAHELKQLHEAKPQEHSATLYGCALHGLILHDFSNGFALTLSAVRASDSLLAGPGLHILGLVDYRGAGHGEAIEHVVLECKQILRTAGHPLQGTAVGTLARLVNLDEKTIVELLFEAARGETPEALYRLSEFLFREQKAVLNRDWFWPLLLQLAATKAEHSGILQNIDMILMSWVADPARESRALEFLNAWIARQPSQTLSKTGLEKHFPSTFHELARRPGLVNKALTGWLLEDDTRYPLIAQKAVSHLRAKRVTTLSLDSILIDKLKANEIRFLLRRILGYIIGDEPQIRLVFSLVHIPNAKERTFPWVAGVLRDQVGYDYPHQTIEFLNDRARAQDASDDIKALCNDIAAALQAQLDALDALPRLKEFRPPSSKMRRFVKERGKQMNKAINEASKHSIFRELASNVVLKAGPRTFQSINGGYTEPMELKEMSHSIALPRSEVCDPAGAARERVLHRMAKRDTP